MTAPAQPASGSVISARTSSPVLVGRAAELRALVQTTTHFPSVVLVEGEAGIGKTRLLRELHARTRQDSEWLTWGTCAAFREPFPFGPFVEALSRAASRLPEVSTMNPVTGVLRPVLAELSDHLPPPLESLGEPEAERHRLFRAFRSLLCACGPTVLVLEDLHWADEGTWELLSFLNAQPCPSLAMVLTYRPEDMPAHRGTLLSTAQRHHGEVTSTLIQLAPLGRTDVRTLASSLLGDTPISHEFAARLHERTAGIPFVVEETVRALGDSVAERAVDSARASHLLDELKVPSLLRDTIGERLSSLSSEAAHIVQTLAVLGAPETARTLSSMIGTTVSNVNTALLEALRCGVVLEPEPNCYGFRHTLALRAVYDTIPGPRRQQLHLCAAHALRTRREPPLGLIAGHFRAADHLPEWLDTAEAAADKAEERGDSVQATRILQDMLEEPALEGDQLDRVALKLSTAAHGAVGQQHVTDALGGILTNERVSPMTRSKVRLHRGMLLTRQPGGVEAGRADLARAVEQLREVDPDSAIYGMSVLAKPDDGMAPFEEHARWLHSVNVELRRTGNREVIANVLANQLHVLVQIGDPDAGRRVRELATRPRTRIERRHLTRAHLNLGDAYMWVGNYERAHRFLRSGLAIAGDDGPPYLLSIARATQAHVDWWTGRWSGLRERAAGLLEEYVDVRTAASELSLVLGSLAISAGERETAESFLRRPGLVDHGDSCTPMVIAAAAAMTHLYLAANNDEQAHAEAVRGLDIVRRKGIWGWGARLLPEAVQACCRLGRLDQARSVTDEFDQGIRDREAPLAKAASHHCHGIILRWSGQHLPSARALERARSAYEALPAPYLAALAAEQAAHCQMRRGGDDATSSLCQVAEVFDRLGATTEAARCRHDLRAAGSAPPSRQGRRGYGAELSPREREVARLMANGQTNRAIADVLLLSPRTVEHHAARVLRKLDVKSRAELVPGMVS